MVCKSIRSAVLKRGDTKERGDCMNLTVKLGNVQKTIQWPDAPAKPNAVITFGGKPQKK